VLTWCYSAFITDEGEGRIWFIERETFISVVSEGRRRAMMIQGYTKRQRLPTPLLLWDGRHLVLGGRLSSASEEVFTLSPLSTQPGAGASHLEPGWRS